MVKLWQDLESSVAHSSHRLGCQFIAPHPPLLLQVRFNNVLGSRTQTQSHRVGILAFPKALSFKSFFHLYASLKSMLARELPALGIDGSILSKHVDLVQLVSSAKLKIVPVMSWGDLHATCTKLLVHIAVSHHDHLPIRKERMHELLAMVLGISCILRMHGYSHITQHRLQTGGRHNQAVSFGSLQHVLEFAQHAHLHFSGEARYLYHRLSSNIFVVHLQVRQGCAQMWAPIH
mmetsp:Transcript_35431/g.81055  ORF Transcript_35431/g.81055 Transcript_35431/m.81055 type:complete len:233 (-) Transcript_35431:919-1617(-)